MVEISPRQAIQLLLEATGQSATYSGKIEVVHAQNWGIRHIIINGKTFFMDKRYKNTLTPALKAMATPVIRSGGGVMTYRLHDGVSVDIKFESYEEQKEIKEDLQNNRGTFKLSKVAFMATLNKFVLRRWIGLIERGKSSTPLQELTNQYAKLA